MVDPGAWPRHLYEWLRRAHEWVLFVIGLGVSASLFAHAKEMFHWLKPTRPAPYWLERLCSHYRNEDTVHFFGEYSKEPSIEVVGEVELTAEQKNYAAQQNPRVNDPHAVIVELPDWSSASPHIKVRGLDYKQVLALTQTGNSPQPRLHLISANAVIVCPERKELILHRRAAESRTYPHCLHTVGGGYMPPGIGPKDDQYSLKETVIREVDEETRVHFTIDTLPRILAMLEERTGFVQFAFLGVRISGAQCDQLPQNPNPAEGRRENVPFDQLGKRLLESNWVPTGRAAVLAWLGLGAPGAGWHPRFGRRTAGELFDEILRNPEPHPSEAMVDLRAASEGARPTASRTLGR